MKSDDVLTLANKARAARRSMNFYDSVMRNARHENNQNVMESSEKSFLLAKEHFCTIMDCIAVVSRDAGNESRYVLWPL